MSHHLRLIAVLSIILVLSTTSTLSADGEDDWRVLKAESKRAKIDEIAQWSLDKVLAGKTKAQTLFDSSYGWAAFDNLKIAVLLSGGGGNGVAVCKESGQRTYMKMGTAGIGLGLGGQKYQVVFFFQNEQTFNRFVEKGWQADASAQAAAGNEGANVTTGFINGIAVWQITDKGLMASADVTGTKYWKNKKLN